MSYLPNFSANAQKIVKMFAFAFDSAITQDIVSAGAESLNAGATAGQVLQALFNITGVSGSSYASYGSGATDQAFLTDLVANMSAGTVVSSSYQAALVSALTPYLRLFSSRGEFAAALMSVIESVPATTTDTSLLALKNVFVNRAEVAGFYAQTSAGLVFASWTQVRAPVASVSDDVATVDAATTGGLSSAYEHTYTLTTEADSLTGASGNNLFTATNTPTSVVLTRNDSVIGGGVSNTFNVADTATRSNAAFAFPSGMTISNIQKENIATSGSFGALSLGTLFDLSAQAGLASLSLTATGTLGSYIKVGNATALSVTLTTAAPSKIMGGSTVSVTNTTRSSSGSITVTGSSGLTSATVAANGAGIVVDDMNGGTTSNKTLTTVTVSGMAGGASTSLKGGALTSVTVGAASTGAGAQTVTITNATAGHTMNYTLNGAGYDAAGTTAATTLVDAVATTVTVSVSAPSDVALVNKLATNVIITGTAALKLEATTSFASKIALIDASSNTGGLTMTDAFPTAVLTGSAGNDTITLTGALTTATGGSISLGAGNNTLLAGTGGSIGAGVTVNGGTGSANVISAALVTAANAASIVNFQVLDISGYGGTFDASLMSSSIGTLNLSTRATSAAVTILNTAANLTISNTADTSTASTLTVTHAGSATNNTIALNYASTATTSTNTETIATLTSTGDASIAITSGGASTATGFGNALTSLVETDNHLVIVGISGAKPFTLGAVHLNTGATHSGAAVTVASSLITIDGSAATGALNITAGSTEYHVSGSTTITAGTSLAANAINVTYAGLIIKGGAGGDTITNNAAGGSIVAGATGAGKINRLTVSGAGARIDDTASAGDDILTLSGGGQSAALGSGTTTVYVDHASAVTTVGNSGTVTLGTGTATVASGLKYVAVASAVSANTGNLLHLDGTLHANSLQFGTIANASGLLGAVSIVAGANLDQAIFNGESATANTVTWFQFGGNTYVEYSGAASGTADNRVVELTGLVDLSATVVTTGANGSLLFA